MAIVIWLPAGERPKDDDFSPDGETFPTLPLALGYVMNRPDRYEGGRLPWIKADGRIISYEAALAMYTTLPGDDE